MGWIMEWVPFTIGLDCVLTIGSEKNDALSNFDFRGVGGGEGGIFGLDSF